VRLQSHPAAQGPRVSERRDELEPAAPCRAVLPGRRQLCYLLLLFGACSEQRCGSDTLAVLVERTGDVERDHAASSGRFEPAAVRAHFVSGDGLRTGEHARARLELSSSGSVLVQEATTIRLWRGQGRPLQVNVQAGAARVSATQPLSIYTELGVAVLDPGSELHVLPAQRYAIAFGRATLTTADGRQVTLGPGEQLGAAAETRELTQASTLSAVASAPVPDALPWVAAQPGDLELRAGESATIYDPEPESRVRFAIPETCVSGASLSLQRAAALSPLAPDRSLRLAPGTYAYRVVCGGADGAAEWSATLRVVRSAGTAELPRTAPTNYIAADGRTYTVLFQNLLPAVEVRWPDAPAAPSYNLSLRLGAGPVRSFSTQQPVYKFAAGALPEGRYRLQFGAGDGGAKSASTTLDLRFDNVSSKASLRAPPVAGFEAGPAVRVAGLAFPGAVVSVWGQRLGLDAQQRFSGAVTLPAGAHTLPVRIQHPRTGTRYYLRHAKVAP